MAYLNVHAYCDLVKLLPLNAVMAAECDSNHNAIPNESRANYRHARLPQNQRRFSSRFWPSFMARFYGNIDYLDIRSHMSIAREDKWNICHIKY